MTKLELIARQARQEPRCRFTSLAHLLDEDFLARCYQELKKDKASGVDGVSVEEYGRNLQENLKGLVGRMKAKQYRPQPVRRVYIPKGSGGDAGKVLSEIKARLAKFGLEVAAEKTRIIEFGRFAKANAKKQGGKPATFDFLGFTRYSSTTLKGRFMVGRRTSGKKFRRDPAWRRRAARAAAAGREPALDRPTAEGRAPLLAELAAGGE